jgi:hypothetical protein
MLFPYSISFPKNVDVLVVVADMNLCPALTITKAGYTIHVGYDEGDTIIRAIKGKHTLELIPRTAFQYGNLFDLPEALVSGCVHWL